jgi:hypothetical protein
MSGEEKSKKNYQMAYKNEKYASLQVFLEKNMVMEFKEKAKQNNQSQAEVIRGFIKSYLSKQE